MHWLDLIMFIIIWLIIYNVTNVKSMADSNDSISASIGFVLQLIIFMIYSILYLIIFTLFDINWSDLAFIPSEILIGDIKILL